jgi:SAM-dependent methyltransferase
LVLPDAEGPVLDFGCGDSPYRTLLRSPIYHRADRAGEEGLDFEIHPDETIDALGATYHTILSTQVLEHVDLHMSYLRECHRLLAPGGRLLITTHGFFEEHGHPNDFRRWMLTGLSSDLEKAGFVIERAHKLTVGPRALLYLLGSQIWKVDASRKTPLGFLLSGLRGFITRYPHRWNQFVDRHFKGFQLRAGPAGDESLFIGIGIQARKP